MDKKSEICAALCDLVKDGKISAIDVIKFESTNYLSKETIKMLDPSLFLLGNVRFKPMEVEVVMPVVHEVNVTMSVEAKPKTEVIQRPDAPWKF